MSIERVAKCVELMVLQTIERECQTVCLSQRVKSVLRQTSATALQNFTWNHLLREWKEHAPTFYKFLEISSGITDSDSLDPFIGCAG